MAGTVRSYIIITPVELFTGDRPLLGRAQNFFERVRSFFAADRKKDAGCDDGGLGVAIDIHTLALEAFTLLSFESVFRICVFDDLIVNDCLALVDFPVVRLGQRDDWHRKAEVAPLLFNDGEPLPDA